MKSQLGGGVGLRVAFPFYFHFCFIRAELFLTLFLDPETRKSWSDKVGFQSLEQIEQKQIRTSALNGKNF